MKIEREKYLPISPQRRSTSDLKMVFADIFAGKSHGNDWDVSEEEEDTTVCFQKLREFKVTTKKYRNNKNAGGIDQMEHNMESGEILTIEFIDLCDPQKFLEDAI